MSSYWTFHVTLVTCSKSFYAWVYMRISPKDCVLLLPREQTCPIVTPLRKENQSVELLTDAGHSYNSSLK